MYFIKTLFDIKIEYIEENLENLENIDNLDNVYKKENTQLESFIVNIIEEWNQDNSKDYLLGSIIYTLSTRDYHIDEFINIFACQGNRTQGKINCNN